MQIAVFTSRKNASDPFQSDAFFIIIESNFDDCKCRKKFCSKDRSAGIITTA